MDTSQEMIQRCSICNGTNTEDCGSEWRLQKCNDCGHTVGISALEKLSSAKDNFFNDDQYIAFRSKNKSFFEKMAAERATDLRNHVYDLWEKSLLDIGCSVGEFLNAVAKDCRTVKGQDTAAGVIEYAKKVYGVAIYENLTEIAPEQFDIVTAFHVIEHVAAPHEFISHIKEFIKPNGWINIRTPNVGSFTARASGKNWPGISIEHTQLFTPRSLETLLQQNGFDEIKVLTRSHARFPVGALQRYLKGGNRIDGKGGSGGNRTSGATRLKIMRMLNVVYLPISFLEGWMHGGDEVVIFARKADDGVSRMKSGR